MRAFAASLDPDVDGVLVLVDADDDDPELLRSELTALAKHAGLSRAACCVAIEETEAFYLGDLKALKRAFPEADMKLARAYEPDSVIGTWEYFGQVINDGGENKVAWADAISPYLTTDPKVSRSPSFKEFVRQLVLLQHVPKGAPKVRKYRHPTKPRTPTRRR